MAGFYLSDDLGLPKVVAWVPSFTRERRLGRELLLLCLSLVALSIRPGVRARPYPKNNLCCAHTRTTVQSSIPPCRVRRRSSLKNRDGKTPVISGNYSLAGFFFFKTPAWTLMAVERAGRGKNVPKLFCHACFDLNAEAIVPIRCAIDQGSLRPAGARP
jgi:hypothetical protein